MGLNLGGAQGSQALVRTLADLVAINSINPAYAQGRPEAEIQAYILDFFRQHGISAREQAVMPGRSNVIGVLPGRVPGKRIVFEAHSDTAGIEGMTVPPFAAEVRDGRLYGRGACDTKAGLAGMLHAIADLRRSGTAPEAEIWVVAAVDEEHAYRGIVRVLEGLQADAAVVSEPTEMRMVVASKGCLRWRIVVQGKAAHSSKPHLGVNAIYGMARVLASLEANAARLRSTSHPLVGSPTLSVGTIAGGSQVNIVPASCTIDIDRRLIPGEDPEQVYSEYEQVVAELRQQDSNLDVTMQPPDLQDWPLQTDVNSPLVQIGSEVLRSNGLNGDPAGVAFGSDASKFARAGVPSVIFGPGSIDQAHTVDEFVNLEEVETAFLVYRDLMRKYQVDAELSPL
jgi:acetylornithine deacetylase